VHTLKPKSRRDQILEVAARQFASHGYAGTSMRGLAEEVGISAPAIYRHFPNKLTLFEHVIELRSRGTQTREYLETLRALDDIEDVLRSVSLHLLTTAKQRPEVLKLLLMTSVCEDPAATKLLQEVRAPYVDFLRTEVARRIAGGELMPVDPQITARCYIGMVIGCAINAELWNPMEGIEQNTLAIVDNNVPIFARGLRVPLDSENAEKTEARSGPDKEADS
jgi:AcrR family transcriptional regulator